MMTIDILAKWIWDPLLCLIYLELGIIFLYLTRAVAWRKSFQVFMKIIVNDSSTSNDRVVSHKKAFFSSVAATVGIGNIAGVGTAIHLGGPGALFWMWVSALFGMFFRMVSTYLTIKMRPEDENSLSFATPMLYLEKYMTGKWSFIPKIVALLLMIQGVVLYNMVQANSLAQAMHNRFDIPNLLIAVVMTLCVGVVILGGLQKIVDYCSAIAPIVIIVYVLTGLLVLLLDPIKTISGLGNVFASAFMPYSIAGGVAGYTVLQAMQFGVSRGVFSHMSGMGTSTFLQGANKDNPAAGAFMAAITPFVDTIIICTISGLVILSGSDWQYETGAHLTALAFEAGIGFTGQVVVVISLIVFALTTIAGFAHISERCFKYLGGKDATSYRMAFLTVTFMGPFLNLRFVWSLSDIIIAMTIVFHLIPLLYVTLKNNKEICKELFAFSEEIQLGTNKFNVKIKGIKQRKNPEGRIREKTGWVNEE
ncbi:MAG: sodium:alanine symporter family protein [Desulfamplus sp.]|nr:sodium:alanine symporter family protein [Desulfamplus sp.]